MAPSNRSSKLSLDSRPQWVHVLEPEAPEEQPYSKIPSDRNNYNPDVLDLQSSWNGFPLLLKHRKGKKKDLSSAATTSSTQSPKGADSVRSSLGESPFSDVHQVQQPVQESSKPDPVDDKSQTLETSTSSLTRDKETKEADQSTVDSLVSSTSNQVSEELKVDDLEPHNITSAETPKQEVRKSMSMSSSMTASTGSRKKVLPSIKGKIEDHVKPRRASLHEESWTSLPGIGRRQAPGEVLGVIRDPHVVVASSLPERAHDLLPHLEKSYKDGIVHLLRSNSSARKHAIILSE
mmetsp:Transcript_33521/g.54334  ORF Transcript_33521/g.54334 Transcript_33521/m.54334 type:complete len:292 (+) Transcript_33521:167-1042(+)|eukprot:CAMPEP_0184647754 /NCGR_PEP_ID=MMETSP0308-20130426/4761_1 /TAXON_ID=38269 /ORGANISM="Gloeochaete witrockiana, Strain SAG 46.84" /LENGTH=291 /DNA_ID=CAMNT_0027079013 /DNA_START=134 /DNA_END=1009 /DNA_ORIENTATION=-